MPFSVTGGEGERGRRGRGGGVWTVTSVRPRGRVHFADEAAEEDEVRPRGKPLKRAEEPQHEAAAR